MPSIQTILWVFASAWAGNWLLLCLDPGERWRATVSVNHVISRATVSLRSVLRCSAVGHSAGLLYSILVNWRCLQLHKEVTVVWDITSSSVKELPDSNFLLLGWQRSSSQSLREGYWWIGSGSRVLELWPPIQRIENNGSHRLEKVARSLYSEYRSEIWLRALWVRLFQGSDPCSGPFLWDLEEEGVGYWGS